MKAIQAYRFALDLTPGQERDVYGHAGAARVAHNWALARVKAVSKEAFNTGLDGLARGLKNWADFRTGKRSGKPVGFPRFKSRRRTTPSVRFTTGAIRVEPDRMHVVLPRLGRDRPTAR